MAQTEKHAAPRETFQVAMVGPSGEPVDAATSAAAAETPKKTQPRRLIADPPS
jgi:hypothetical protein